MAVHKVFRKTEFQTYLSDFVLKQVAKRFYNIFKIYEIRKTPHIVVRFDDCGFTAKS